MFFDFDSMNLFFIKIKFILNEVSDQNYYFTNEITDQQHNTPALLKASKASNLKHPFTLNLHQNFTRKQ